MKDEIVVYRTKSGFTEKYAKWIAEELECECLPFESVTKNQLMQYRRVVIGGYVRYEALDNATAIAQLVNGLPDVTIFIVGATPMTDRIATGYMLRRTYKRSKAFRYIPHFYLQGGMDPEKLGRFERFLIKVMIFAISHTSKATPQMKAAAERMRSKADFSNRNNICALVEYVKAGRDVPL